MYFVAAAVVFFWAWIAATVAYARRSIRIHAQMHDRTEELDRA